MGVPYTIKSAPARGDAISTALLNHARFIGCDPCVSDETVSMVVVFLLFGPFITDFIVPVLSHWGGLRDPNQLLDYVRNLLHARSTSPGIVTD